MASRDTHLETDLVHLAQPHSGGRRFVNPAVQRGSTILFPTLDDLFRSEDPFQHHRYGRQGTPTNRAFEEAMTALEHGYRTFSASSGLAAIVLVLTTFSASGSHILVSDNAYSPTRDFCTGTLARFGVETEFFDPTIGAGLRERLRRTRRLSSSKVPAR